MGKKLLLLEFDSFFVGDRRPMPTTAWIRESLRRYMHGVKVEILEPEFGSPDPSTVKVTMPRQHPHRK